MLENLLRPWILARLLLGLSSTVLTAYGALVALRVLRRPALAATSEEGIAIDRQAELAAVIVQTALGAAALGLLLSAAGADRAHDAIRGAMCAYGVFSSTASGFASLATSAVVTLACGGWLALHRLDLALVSPVLTRPKFLALLVVAPLVALDFATTARFLLELDFGVVATCCSSGLDRAPSAARAGAEALTVASYPSALAAIGVAMLASAWTARKPSARVARTAAAASLVAGLLAVPAIVGVVAPHAYGSPTHRCPFCLLHREALGLGWPLFFALVAGATVGMALLVVERERSLAGEAVDAIGRRLGRLGAFAWLVVLVLSVAPVLAYRFSHGTFLFGFLA